MKPWQGIGHLRRIAALATVALLWAALLGTCVAEADESAWPTAQASAYNFAWVPYLDPPEKPAAICLVDSGIDVTPDTPADSPDGPILERTSLDGGPGTGIDSDHGTYMAMEAGAPMNNWGTVGLWPGLRIVSVRALPEGQTTFPFDDYRRATQTCAKRAARYNLVVVNLSLDCNCVYSDDALLRLDDAVADAHARYGLNVIASAGNTGGDIGMPAGASGILSVGAGTADRTLCGYSSRGRTLGLLAPGCGLDGAWPANGQPFTDWVGGTSPAATMASAAIALLRSYDATLSWTEAQDLLAATGDGTSALDLEATFRRAGLGNLVATAQARLRAEQTSAAAQIADGQASTSLGTSSLPTSSAPIPPWISVRQRRRERPVERPEIRTLVHRGRKVLAVIANRPRQAMIVGALQAQDGEFGYTTVRRVARRRDAIALLTPRRWRGGRLVLRFKLRAGPDARFRPVYRGLGR